MKIELTPVEALMLADEMDHAPECDIGGCVEWYQDDDGNTWTDSTCTVPFTVERTTSCSCGYFNLRTRAVAKVRAALSLTTG